MHACVFAPKRGCVMWIHTHIAFLVLWEIYAQMGVSVRNLLGYLCEE